MTALPSASSLTAVPNTHANIRTQLGNLRAFLAGLLGEDGLAATALTLLGAIASSHMTKSADYTATAEDAGAVIDASGTWVLTLPAMVALPPAWATLVRNMGAGTVTLTPPDSATIDGATSLALLPGRTALVMANGTGWMTCQSTVAEASTTVAGLMSAADKAVLAGLGPFATATVINLDTEVSGTLQAAQMPALTGDVTLAAGTVVTSLADNSVGNGKLAQIATARLKGRVTAGSGNVEDLTAAQVKAMLAIAAADIADIADYLALAGTQTVTGDKTFSGSVTFNGALLSVDGNMTIKDNADPTKQAKFQIGSVPPGTLVQYTLPAATGTIPSLEQSQTFTGASINFGGGTGAYAASLGGGATLSGNTKTVNIATAGLAGSTANVTIGGGTAGVLGTLTINSPTVTFGANVTAINLPDAATFLVDTADVTKKAKFELSGLTPGTTRTLTVPDASGSLVLADATQTLTNKSIAATQLTGTLQAAQMPALTGDVTTVAGALPAIIVAGVVTNAKLAQMATARLKGRATAGTGAVEDLTGTEATALLDAFTASAKGLVPASGGRATGMLRADGVFAPPFARNSPFVWKGQAGSTTVASFGGGGPVAVGVASAASLSTANLFGMTPKVEYLVTAAASNAVAGFRTTTALVTLGGSAAGLGGFHFIGRWGPATGVATATTRAFFGLANVTAAPTDVEPSTIVNCVAMGWDAADTNVQMMCNDASGTCTKVDLGASFPVPTTDRTALYELEMYSPKGTTQSLVWTVTDLVSGATASGTTATDLPAATLGLNPRGWISAGGTTSVIGLALNSMFLDPLLT